jgi:hypothetical protein
VLQPSSSSQSEEHPEDGGNRDSDAQRSAGRGPPLPPPAAAEDTAHTSVLLVHAGCSHPAMEGSYIQTFLLFSAICRATNAYGTLHVFKTQ